MNHPDEYDYLWYITKYWNNQEVVQLLRSLPIIGPWNKKQRPSGTTGTAVAGCSGGDGGESGGQNRGFRNGRYYEEEFAVAPADLLAFDEVSTLLALLGCLRFYSFSVVFVCPLLERVSAPCPYSGQR